jgi:hypothetical protein
MTFRNPILGAGGSTLLRPAIQSPGYVTGSTGWAVKRDGSAEFNNIVIRGGTVVSGLALYYDGTPAAGNLILSIAAAAGVDAFGNAYVKGLGVYKAAGTVTAKDAAGDTAVLAGNVGGGGLLASLPGLRLQLASNAGDPATVGALDDGTHTNLALLLTSPSNVVGGIPGTDYSQIKLTGPDSAPTEIDLTAALTTIGNTFFDASGVITSYDINTFTPTVGNDGTATYSTRTGWWVQMGPLRYVCIYLVVNAAGSGTGNVTVSVPFTVDRSTRQTLAMHTESVGPNGSHVGNGQCVFFVGGTGGVADRLRTSSNDATNRDSNITGADMLANGIIVIEGFLRAA